MATKYQAETILTTDHGQQARTTEFYNKDNMNQLKNKFKFGTYIGVSVNVKGNIIWLGTRSAILKIIKSFKPSAKAMLEFLTCDWFPVYLWVGNDFDLSSIR